jgi:hypothetical protein
MADGAFRRPTPGRRFTWSKIEGERFITYRLFRRSLHRRVHVRQETFIGISRSDIARQVRAMRKALLDEVDAVDLRFLGVTEEVPA